MTEFILLITAIFIINNLNEKRHNNKFKKKKEPDKPKKPSNHFKEKYGTPE
jgi:hypothetical protein